MSMLFLRFWVFASLVAFTVVSANPDLPLQPDKLTAYLERINTLQADFDQTTFSKDGKVLQKVSGKLAMAKPHKFYWQAFQPFPQLLISDGETLWQFDEDLEQVTIRSYQTESRQVDMIQLLETPKKLTELFEQVAMEEGNGVTTFQLKARKSSDAIKQLGFTFKNKLLAELYYVDALNQKTQLIFKLVKVNQSIKAALFSFEPPKEADVVDMRQTITNPI